MKYCSEFIFRYVSSNGLSLRRWQYFYACHIRLVDPMVHCRHRRVIAIHIVLMIAMDGRCKIKQRESCYGCAWHENSRSSWSVWFQPEGLSQRQLQQKTKAMCSIILSSHDTQYVMHSKLYMIVYKANDQYLDIRSMLFHARVIWIEPLHGSHCINDGELHDIIDRIFKQYEVLFWIYFPICFVQGGVLTTMTILWCMPYPIGWSNGAL